MNDTFCPLPFRHLNLKSGGKVAACCMYTTEIGDSTNQSLEQIWHSKELEQLRDELVNGVQSKGCKKCWEFESAGASSLRTRELERCANKEEIISFYKNNKVIPLNNMNFIEIRFDTICNLMCKMCGPHSSHKWAKEVKSNPILFQEMKKYGVTSTVDLHEGRGSINPDILKEIIDLSPNLTEIWISGGEPLYSPLHYDFIEKLLPEAHHISLHYPTNLTLLEYKNKDILNLWKHFKNVKLRASIDGADQSTYEYIRTSGDITDVENNIRKLKQYPNITLQACGTFSILNILRIVDIAKYFKKLELPFRSATVQYPAPMSSRLLPNELKLKITKEWNQFLNDNQNDVYYNDWVNWGTPVINYMNSADLYQDWVLFQNYITAIDQNFGSSVLDVFPEFKLYWN